MKHQDVTMTNPTKTDAMDSSHDLSLHESTRHQPRSAYLCPTSDPRLVERVTTSGIYELAESYASGDWNFDPLDDLMAYVFARDISSQRLPHYRRAVGYLLRDLLSNPQSGSGAYKIAHEHYDLGNDLFTAMLDSSMSYTCGYWAQAKTLEESQFAKLDLSCKKLGLKPGMRVLDIGCGWGNFAKFAASHYGVSVVGVTVSKEQAALARQRCEGLPVEIIIQDYREISGAYDRAISIEMIEAVGKKNLPTYFSVVDRSLKKDGLFLLEVISADTGSRLSSPTLNQFLMWILRYIFPNGYLPQLTELTEPARKDFVIEDLHSFGADYDKTLIEWDKNFTQNWASLSAHYPEIFKRRWRFYLLSCAALFRIKRTHLYQIVYAKAGSTARYEPVR